MATIDYPKVIKERAEELRQLEKEQHKVLVRDRVRFLWLLKSGRCSSQIEAGELIGLSARSSQRLWQQYRNKGLGVLLTYPYQGTSYRLTEQQRERPMAYLAEDQVQFLHEAKACIQQYFGVRYSIGRLHKIFIADVFWIAVGSYMLNKLVVTPSGKSPI